MDFNLVKQNEGLIEDFFFIFIDKYKEIFCGKNLEDLKSKMELNYKENILSMQSEHGDAVNLQSLTEYINSIEESELNKFEFKIKKPNYTESSQIISKATNIDIRNGAPIIDYAEYNRQRILTLLKYWNLEEDGKKATINSATIGSLHPTITDQIIYHINNKIPHYLNALIS